MKSFRKFILEKADTGGLIDDTGLQQVLPPIYTDPTSPLQNSVPAATQTKGSNKAYNPRSSLGFLLPNGLDKTALANMAYEAGLIPDVNTNLNTTQLNNLIASNNQNNQAFLQMASTIPFQQVGVDGNTVQQIGQYLSVNGFLLDEKYDALLKIYMEMEQSKNAGKQLSPWIAANKMVAQKMAQQTKQRIGALNDLDSGSFKIPDFDPLDDLISTGLYDKPQQGMPGMGGIPLDQDVGDGGE
jgi:sporulation protein YlmC with PRC-barrel domain